jgi:hypothetical protein
MGIKETQLSERIIAQAKELAEHNSKPVNPRKKRSH